ncbi:TAM domain methyltransferase [Colletotrichum fioriniae PJ7]|uniref:TAM domain methyltransferase n=1 Tax=Colletotrichum fioriniae PJ7 TaxID=1445577 RepID=A0A010RV73_9PEZI|nr:TAM domain methyltransferase [Colletotrichum fioriniae PJ7]
MAHVTYAFNAEPSSRLNSTFHNMPPVDDNEDLVADEVTEDVSSVFGNSTIASSATSVAISVLDYRLENGRTYHRYKDGKYYVPNDEREKDRLDLQHNMFLLMFENKLGSAPPNEKGTKVGRTLDLGTGSGIWAMEFGDEHPEAEVLGIDLSATWPNYVGPNVKFMIDDIEEPWTYAKPFDYIHSRMMASSIGDWETYIQRSYDNLNAGGYLELIEFDIIPTSDDGTLRKDAAMLKSSHMIKEAAAIFGRPFRDVVGLADIMRGIGFRDVHIKRFRWPTNAWPKDPRHKELGLWNNENITSGWEGFCMAPFTRALNWTREEVLLLMDQVRHEFNDKSIHAYFNVWSIHGRKPTAEEIGFGNDN